MLAGMLKDDEGIAADILAKLGARPDDVRRLVDVELSRMPVVTGQVGSTYLAPETSQLFEDALKEIERPRR